MVFGTAHGLRRRAGRRPPTGWRSCGSGCMGFVNVDRRGPRDRLPRARPAAGRPDRAGHPLRLGLLRAAAHAPRARVHHGRLVGPGAGHHHRRLPRLRAQHAGDPGRRAWCSRRCATCPACAAALAEAAARDVPVVALTVGVVDRRPRAGRRPLGRPRRLRRRRGRRCSRRTACTGSATSPSWSTPSSSSRIGRRVRSGTGSGIATVHDSGAERVLVADVAERVGVPFAPLADADRQRGWPRPLDPGLAPTNPLDVWGGGRDTEDLFTECLSALADDPGVDVVALAVDLVPEYDGDEAFPQRHGATGRADPQAGRGAGQPGLPRSTRQAAARLRALGIPVLEGTGSGLLALRHLRAPAPLPRAGTPPVDDGTAGAVGRAAGGGALAPGRRRGAARRLRGPRRALTVGVRAGPTPLAAAAELGGTVVLKTASGVAPQGRRRRRPARADRPGRRRRGVRRPRRPPRTAGAGAAAGRPGVELSAGHRAGPAVRVAGGRRRRRHPGRAGRRARGRAGPGRPADGGDAAGRHPGGRAAGRVARPAGRRQAADGTRSPQAISALSVVAHELGDQLEVARGEPAARQLPSGVVAVDALLR